MDTYKTIQYQNKVIEGNIALIKAQQDIIKTMHEMIQTQDKSLAILLRGDVGGV